MLEIEGEIILDEIDYVLPSSASEGPRTLTFAPLSWQSSLLIRFPFFNLLPFCLSFCPQPQDESQSGIGDESITGHLVDAFPDETLRNDLSFFCAQRNRMLKQYLPTDTVNLSAWLH